MADRISLRDFLYMVGANNEGYWNSFLMSLQFEDIVDCLQVLYLESMTHAHFDEGMYDLVDGKPPPNDVQKLRRLNNDDTLAPKKYDLSALLELSISDNPFNRLDELTQTVLCDHPALDFEKLSVTFENVRMSPTSSHTPRQDESRTPDASTLGHSSFRWMTIPSSR